MGCQLSNLAVLSIFLLWPLHLHPQAPPFFTGVWALPVSGGEAIVNVQDEPQHTFHLSNADYSDFSVHPDPHHVFSRPTDATMAGTDSAAASTHFEPATVNPPSGLGFSEPIRMDEDYRNLCSKLNGAAAGSENIRLRCMEVDLSKFGPGTGFGDGEKKRFCMPPMRDPRP